MWTFWGGTGIWIIMQIMHVFEVFFEKKQPGNHDESFLLRKWNYTHLPSPGDSRRPWSKYQQIGTPPLFNTNLDFKDSSELRHHGNVPIFIDLSRNVRKKTASPSKLDFIMYLFWWVGNLTLSNKPGQCFFWDATHCSHTCFAFLRCGPDFLNTHQWQPPGLRSFESVTPGEWKNGEKVKVFTLWASCVSFVACCIRN